MEGGSARGTRARFKLRKYVLRAVRPARGRGAGSYAAHMYAIPCVPGVRLRPWARALTVGAGGLGLLALTAVASAGSSNLQETTPLVWVMVAISVAGAIITWGIMVYALWKFRDPATRRRRYG
jgi:hypothetical protein